MKKCWMPLALLCLCTSPAASARARTTPQEVKLDNRSKQQFSRFFQDIVSTYVDDFERGNAPNQMMVSFGIYYLGLRQPELFKDVEDPHYCLIRIAAKHAEAAAQQFFGRKIRHQSAGDWKYKNRSYSGGAELFEQLDAEKIKKFTIFDHGHGRYVAYVNYVDGMATATSEPEEEVIVKTRMTLQKITLRGKSRHILIGYKTLTPRI